MPKDTYNQTNLSDTQIQDLFKEIKPSYKVNEDWLEAQRAQLQGALEVLGTPSGWTRAVEQIQLWWDGLPFMLGTVRPALAWSAALVLGVVIGRFVLAGPAIGTPGAIADDGASGPIDLAEMIRSGRVKDIDIDQSDDPENPITLTLKTGRDIQLTGSTDRDDILTALEYVLVKDPNPGQRLQSARILGNIGNLESRESTVISLVSALLTDENPGVRLSIVKSLQGLESPIVKDALIKTTLEDSNEGVRLASVVALGLFLDDLSVRSALLLASRLDEAESVRYQAYHLLSESQGRSEEESLDIQP